MRKEAIEVCDPIIKKLWFSSIHWKEYYFLYSVQLFKFLNKPLEELKPLLYSSIHWVLTNMKIPTTYKDSFKKFDDFKIPM